MLRTVSRKSRGNSTATGRSGRLTTLLSVISGISEEALSEARLSGTHAGRHTMTEVVARLGWRDDSDDSSCLGDWASLSQAQAHLLLLLRIYRIRLSIGHTGGRRVQRRKEYSPNLISFETLPGLGVGQGGASASAPAGCSAAAQLFWLAYRSGASSPLAPEPSVVKF
eukprot:scaffold9795_cov146-Isochrysis_galbana.AAC.3